MRFLLAAVAVVLGMTSCDEFKSFIDNPVQSYLEVRQTELYVQEGQSVMLYVHTISDAAVTYTVGDEKIAKVEKVDNLDAKVTGVKPGETEVTVKLAATDAYQGGEVKVKIIVAPAVTLADAVKDGAKLKIACKFNGEDCLLAYKFDADKKEFNLSNEDEDINVPEAFVNYTVTTDYNEEMGKIAFKVKYIGSDADMIQVPFELNLYTAGSFDRIFRVPVEMKSVVVNNYDVLPYTKESVTPVESLHAGLLSDNISVGEQEGIFKVDFTPQNATNQVIKYSSSNTAVMTIDDKGVFKAIAAGEATIKAVSAENPAKFVEHKFTVTEGNTYLKWNGKQLVATAIPAGAYPVENSNTDVDWLAGTYVVEDDVTINGSIKLHGEVNLIIKDDVTLTVKGYIKGNSQNLSIYGQTKKSGELVVDYTGTAGFDAISNLTTLEVHSAKVTATSSKDYYGGFFSIKTFNVYDGSVDAKATGAVGYGICMKGGDSLNIYGGEVKAEGKGNGGYGYGIMRTSSTSDATVTVSGGKLLAWNASNIALYNVILTIDKSLGFNGQIYTSSNGKSWDVYNGTDTPDSKYVEVAN